MSSLLLTLLCLLSGASCLDLTFFGIPPLGAKLKPYVAPEIVEVVRWRQPVCVIPAKGVPPCLLGLSKYQAEYEQVSGRALEPETPKPHVRKVLNSDEVRSTISIDELEPSSIEINDSIVATPTIDESIRERRQFPGRILFDNSKHVGVKPPPIYVTKVLNSPITATLVALNCFPDIGVPLCEGYQDQIELHKQTDSPTRVPIQILDIKEPVLKKKHSVFQAFHEFFAKKPSFADIVVNVTSAVSDKLKNKINLDDNAHVSTSLQDAEVPIAFVENKPTIVQDLIDKKDKAVQGIVDKKDQIVQALSNASAEKQKIVQGVIEKKHKVLQSIVDNTQNIVKNIIDKKHNLIQGIEDKKHSIVEDLTHKKDSVVEAIANVSAEKQKIVKGIIDKKHNVLQNIVDRTQNVVQTLIDKKTKIELDIANRKQALIQSIADKKQNLINSIADTKQNIIKHIADKQTDAIKKISDRAQELIGTVSVAKPLLIGTIQQQLGLVTEIPEIEGSFNEAAGNETLPEDLTSTDAEIQETTSAEPEIPLLDERSANLGQEAQNTFISEENTSEVAPSAFSEKQDFGFVNENDESPVTVDPSNNPEFVEGPEKFSFYEVLHKPESDGSGKAKVLDIFAGFKSVDNLKDLDVPEEIPEFRTLGQFKKFFSKPALDFRKPALLNLFNKPTLTKPNYVAGSIDIAHKPGLFSSFYGGVFNHHKVPSNDSMSTNDSSSQTSADPISTSHKIPTNPNEDKVGVESKPEEAPHDPVDVDVLDHPKDTTSNITTAGANSLLSGVVLPPFTEDSTNDDTQLQEHDDTSLQSISQEPADVVFNPTSSESSNTDLPIIIDFGSSTESSTGSETSASDVEPMNATEDSIIIDSRRVEPAAVPLETASESEIATPQSTVLGEEEAATAQTISVTQSVIRQEDPTIIVQQQQQDHDIISPSSVEVPQASSILLMQDNSDGADVAYTNRRPDTFIFSGDLQLVDRSAGALKNQEPPLAGNKVTGEGEMVEEETATTASNSESENLQEIS